MGNTFLERFEAAKNEDKDAHVCFFNDGKVRKDKESTARRIRDAHKPEEYWAIEDTLLGAAKSYIHDAEFDTIDMDLMLGLIYDRRSLINERIIGDAKPIRGIVRYYTGSIKSYLDGKQTNEHDYYEYGVGRQGYIDYNFLLKALKESKLDFTGPESFQEFEECILRGEPFDIKVSASLLSKKKTQTDQVTK